MTNKEFQSYRAKYQAKRFGYGRSYTDIIVVLNDGSLNRIKPENDKQRVLILNNLSQLGYEFDSIIVGQ